MNKPTGKLTYSPGFHFDDLDGKKIILTGANRGIGLGLIPGLLAQGIHLILVARKEAALKRIQEEYEGCGGGIEYAVCDLADREARIRASHEIAARHEVIDGIVHNAAIDPRRRFEELDMDFFRQVMATNVEPAIDITRELLPHLKKSKAPRILLIGSVTFDLGGVYMSAYVASKGALVGLTRSLAHELGPSGITVNCISPGAIVVEKEGRDEEKDQRLINWQSVRRRIVPTDLLAPMCLFLSEAGGGITGQTLSVEGGVTHPMASALSQQKRLAIDAQNPNFRGSPSSK